MLISIAFKQSNIFSDNSFLDDELHRTLKSYMPILLTLSREIDLVKIQQSVNLIPLFGESMQANYRPVYIPPLNLTPKTQSKAVLERILSSGCLDANKQKNSVSLLRNNSGFIKEKSLYRCFISKNKVSQSQEKRKKLEQTNKGLPYPTLKLQKFFSAETSNKNGNSMQSSMKANNDAKQKYFKRKTNVNRTQINTGKIKTAENMIENQDKQEEKIWLDLLNSEIELNVQPNTQKGSFELSTIGEAQVALLKENNAIIMRENNQLKCKLADSQRKICDLQNTIETIQAEKGKLESMIQNLSNKINHYQKEQQRFVAQLQIKQKMVHQLQNGYKYMQIQSIVLNHAKSQCSKQMQAIQSLQKEKRVLEQKIKIFYELNRKKSEKRGRTRESSQVSLTFSIQNEQTNQSKSFVSPKKPNPQETNMKRSQLSERISASSRKT